MLSKHQLKIKENNIIILGKNVKHILNLGNKRKHILHYQILKLYLDFGTNKKHSYSIRSQTRNNFKFIYETQY